MSVGVIKEHCKCSLEFDCWGRINGEMRRGSHGRGHRL